MTYLQAWVAAAKGEIVMIAAFILVVLATVTLAVLMIFTDDQPRGFHVLHENT